MRKPQQLIILGTAGNCIDILDTAWTLNRVASHPQFECIGFLDDDESKWGTSIHDVAVLGPLSSAPDYPDAVFVNGIGSTSTFWKKAEIIEKTDIPDERFVSLVHPSASVSTLSTLGPGTVVFQHVTICNNVTVGKHVIVLPGSVLSHDDVVGDYTCVAGSVCVSGSVSIGKSCYLGTNCTIREMTNIADYCLVGMSSAVFNDVPENSVVVGNPARFLRHTR